MTYHWVCNKSNTTGATRGALTACPSGAPEFTLLFNGITLFLFFSVVLVYYYMSSGFFSFFWTLYCMSFNWGLLITSLVYSVFSYLYRYIFPVQPTFDSMNSTFDKSWYIDDPLIPKGGKYITYIICVCGILYPAYKDTLPDIRIANSR